jgi:hypothetical protein
MELKQNDFNNFLKKIYLNEKPISYILDEHINELEEFISNQDSNDKQVQTKLSEIN